MSELNRKHRDRLFEIASIVLPGDLGQPPANDLNIELKPVDAVLKSRPDLTTGLIEILDKTDNISESLLQQLTDAEFNLLMTVICAAYLSDRTVKRSLGYDGQQALTPNRGGFGAEELVIELMQQPKRYRPAD